MTPEQVMSRLLAANDGIRLRHDKLSVTEGPYHTDVRASIVYISNEAGERFRVEVRRG